MQQRAATKSPATVDKTPVGPLHSGMMSDSLPDTSSDRVGECDSLKEQLSFWQPEQGKATGKAELRDAAAADNKRQPIHRWVPWIAGFSAQFASDAIDAFLPDSDRDDSLVLDPFAGVGTTLVEALRAGCNVVGYEINGFAWLAAQAKINFVDVDIARFRWEAQLFSQSLRDFEAHLDGDRLPADGDSLDRELEDLRRALPAGFKSRIPFFSAPIEAKFLYALRATRAIEEPDRALFRAALGATMVSYSNYSYEPSLGSRPGADKPLIENASVAKIVGRKLHEMIEDIEGFEKYEAASWRSHGRQVHRSSYFESGLPEHSVSLVVTSPPYMNNYHYVRNTRPQLYWLDLVEGADDLRRLEHESFGKFWQTVRQGPIVDLAFDLPDLARKIDDLGQLNGHKGHYGGRGWANYAATYFNDTDRFVEVLAKQLRPGAHAVVVVGNSIIQGMEFKVDHILGDIAERRGLHVEDINIVRTKRVGNSIIDSSVRNGDSRGHKQKTQLYDAAVILRA